MSKRGDHISIRTQLLLVIGGLILLQSVLFTVGNYSQQRAALLQGIDDRLLTAAYLAKVVPPAGYYDRLVDRSSVPPAEYEAIVEQNNQLCLRLGLQYLWSCMLLDGRIVFTTATSPGKDVRKHDHAGFLEVHGDPHAFDRVFATLQPDYTSFHNEWGHGRMVLVPFTDRNGRLYCVGASLSVDDVRAVQRRTLWRAVGLRAAILALGLLVTVWVSRSLSRPVIELRRVADSMAHGDMTAEIRAKGSSELVSLAQSVTRMRDSIRSTIAALRDEIEQRRAAEQELQAHKEHLEDLVRQRTVELERSNRELEQFAYLASHDLQEPLRKVRSFTELLAERFRPLVDETSARYVGYIVDGASRMQQLIQDLLTYSRLGRQSAESVAVPLNSVLAEALQNLETALQESGGTVTADPLPRVLANPHLVGLVFQNLIGNALKFRRGPPAVHVSAQRQGDLWQVSVRDNGIGIPAEYLGRIFEIFQRLHSQTAYPGTGMGLAICRRIVERQGGRIWAESVAGEGSTFLFTLPAAPEEPEGTQEVHDHVTSD